MIMLSPDKNLFPSDYVRPVTDFHEYPRRIHAEGYVSEDARVAHGRGSGG